eukprot:CAMPEP_0173239574 /NCGR_PEP_ID=MMETSP1142-20121109/13286_1 /TAXON_ID=483371 /ORGANISM="non described non described, Strain CCMP2298" /LENGTH=158 /DNA_ID=CAMNT_0014170599 /DNA_START=112 /DNA_END=589 /DNA_ORIENTATION=+
MDVARFKYPPHWVPLPLLHQAMQRVDQESGLSRGYLLLSAERAWAGSRCVECDCRACSTNQLSDGAHTPGCCASLCSPTPAPLSPSSAHSSNEPLSPSLPSPPDVQTGCCALLDVADSSPMRRVAAPLEPVPVQVEVQVQMHVQEVQVQLQVLEQVQV